MFARLLPDGIASHTVVSWTHAFSFARAQPSAISKAPESYEPGHLCLPTGKSFAAVAVVTTTPSALLILQSRPLFVFISILNFRVPPLLTFLVGVFENVRLVD